MAVTNVGRISGPLLKENLTRTSDLAFETDLLFIGHTNGRIGVKNSAPTRDFQVTGNARYAGDLIATNSASFGNIDIDGPTNTFSTLTGPINMNATTKFQMTELRTGNLAFTNSGIRAYNGGNIEIEPGPGTGKVIIPSDLNTTGNIHATGDISFDGNIFIGGDGPEDTLSFNGDIESNLIPDVTGTYDIGSNGQRWGDMHVQTMTGLNDITIDNTISLSGVAVNLGIANKWYVSTNGTDQLAGNHPNFAFGTIRHALSYIEESTAGPHELHILPGTYTEQFPLEVPANVTVKGAGIRSVTVKPDVPNRYQDAFLMNDASVVTDLTVKDFHYDANTDRGYGFRFSDNAGIVTKSPYVQNVSVVTQGDTRTATDPRGFDSGDAGRGALVDSDVLDTASPRTSMLFNMVTFITPGADAVTVKNGSKIEFINCFTYFANRGLYLQHTLNQYTPTAGSYNPATGVMTLTIGNHAIRVNETITIADNSLTFTCAMDGHATDHTYPRPSDPYSGKKITITETTATSITCNVGISSNVTAHLFKSATANAVTEGTMTEARVIASATIYGNQGVVADGNGSLAYLISHNFAYVGSGKNVENDVDTIDQTNEVVTTNNARVHFVSQDQGGDFRVGDNFIVDLGKGTTSIAVNDGELGASTLTVGVQGKETLVDATKIDVPNFRISNNTIQTLNNGFSIGAVGSSNAVNLTANVLMPKVDITGNATIGGSGLNFGNDAGDTVNFAMDFEQDLLPSQDTQSNIGSATKNWKETNSSRITLDNIDIHNNTIQTTDTNSQLELRASGIGKVNLGTVGFKTNITSASGDVAFSGGTTNTIINSTSHISLPSGTSAQSRISNTTVINIEKTWTQSGNSVTYTYPIAIRIPTITALNNKRIPVAILLHGSGGNGINEIGSWQNYLGDHILVAPTGYNNEWNVALENTKAPDIEFLQDLITQLKLFSNVDNTKIRMVGFSNGSALANRAYVQIDDTALDVICTIGAQFFDPMLRNSTFYIPSDQTGGTTAEYNTAKTPYQPRKFLNIHGTADATIPYTGGTGIFGYSFVDAQQSVFEVAKSQGYTGGVIPDVGGIYYGITGVYYYSYLAGQVTHYKTPAGHGVEDYMKQIIGLFLGYTQESAPNIFLEQGNAVRFDSSINEFELFSTGKIALNGIKDGDRDTQIDLNSNKFTFYTANGYAGEIDGAGNLIVPSFSSQDQVAINGNTIGVGSASNPQAGFTANGTGKVVLDTANLEISGATIENKLVNQDITFTGTGLKQNRTVQFDSLNGYIGPFGSSVQRDAITARLGAIWWNSDSGLLEVYAGAVDGWVSSIGVQSVTVTDEIAAELNVVYNLILN